MYSGNYTSIHLCIYRRNSELQGTRPFLDLLLAKIQCTVSFVIYMYRIKLRGVFSFSKSLSGGARISRRTTGSFSIIMNHVALRNKLDNVIESMAYKDGRIADPLNVIAVKRTEIG